MQSQAMIVGRLVVSLAAVLIVCASASVYEGNKNPGASTGHLTKAGFEIASARNSTGHWNAKIRFAHSADRRENEKDEVDAWNLKFDQKVFHSEEGETITLYATVTIPPAGTAALVEAGAPCATEEPREERKDVDAEMRRRGYELVDGLGYYKFHDVPKTWYGALTKCQAEEAHLLIINSEQEASVVRKLYLEHTVIYGANNDNLAFVGINDVENEGVFITIFGESLYDTGYHKWTGSQPNNYGNEPPGEDCVAVDRDGGYYDWECYHKLAFICERAL